MIAPLRPEDVITAEAPIGVYSFAEVASTAAVDVPTKAALLGGTGLAAPPPAGAVVDDAGLVEGVADELARLLGGWFAGDLRPYLSLHDSLASPELRNYYAAGGMTMGWDEPATAFYWLAFRSPPWQVQAVGEAGDFHCVSFAHPLAQGEALGEGGHPRPLPVGPPLDLLREAAPGVAALALTDETAHHAPNVFDAYLPAAQVAVKGGVRLRVDGTGAPAGERPYFYGVRVVVRLAGVGPS